MSCLVKISPHWRKLITVDELEIFASATTIGGLIQELQSRFPVFATQLLDESGKIPRFVNFLVNDESINYLQSEETILKTGDVIKIIPPICD